MRKIKLTPQASPYDDYVGRRGEEVLREIVRGDRPDDDLIDGAIKYLNHRYGQMEDAGVPIELAAKMDGMDDIVTDIPQEVRVNTSPGVETRYHTQYTNVINPMTGQKDIVPYIDPVTGTGMVTNLGRGVTQSQMDGYEKASEYVQQQIGRLTGSKVIANHSGNRHDTDFTTGSLKFDGETTRPSWRKAGDAIQAYTKVVDKRNPNQHANQMAPAIKKLMQSIIARNPNAGIEEVLRIAEGRLDGGTYSGRRVKPMKGKAFDEDKQAVLLTVLSDADHEYNKKNRDTMPVPVQGAYWQSLDVFREILPEITGRELSSGLQVRPNYGNNRDGEARGRVYITPSRKTASKYTSDLGKLDPRVQQLYDYVQ